MNQTLVEIDVVPCEARQLARTEAERKRKPPERRQAVLVAPCQERRRFLGREGSPLSIGSGVVRDIGEIGGVAHDEVSPLRPAKHRASVERDLPRVEADHRPDPSIRRSTSSPCSGRRSAAGR
jgi:hypothetical protein